jgi:biopolymer transport protein ExbB
VLEQLPQQGEWLALLMLGGPVVLVLLLMSVIALAITLFKLIQFRGVSRRALDQLDSAVTLWCEGSDTEAAAAVAGNRSDVSPVIANGMAWLQRASVDRATAATELGRMAQQILTRLSSLLGVLEQVSYLAPLLGLLGTVLGIIDVFHGLADQGASSNAGMLAGGIWEALLTTAVGLTVAIPFALVHAGLQARVDLVRTRVENMLTRLFTAGLYQHPAPAN